MKRFIPKLIKKCLRYLLLDPFKKEVFKWRLRRHVVLMRKSGNLAFLIATPEHGNLGDHAIVIGERFLLERTGYENRIIEITNSEYLSYASVIASVVSNEDLIIIDGGGNLGTLWPWEDDKITSIITSFINNPIIVFPQTCFYGSDDLSMRRLHTNKQVYEKAKNLTICLRDNESYNFCINNFSSNVCFILVPDIVLSLTANLQFNQSTCRDGILLCMRQDKEKVLNESQYNILHQFLSDGKFIIKETSTVLNCTVNSRQRRYFLNKKLVEFASSKLVITDRLHAMIFAFITNTPCIAFDNVSKKVSGVFNVAKGLNNVTICNDLNLLHSSLHKCYFSDTSTNHFDESRYKELIHTIKSTVK